MYSFESFSHQRYLMVFLRSLSDNKSPQVSRTLPSILVNFNNAVVWMVSTCSLIYKYSSPFTNPSEIVPSAPITNGITVTFMLHSFFSSLARISILFSPHHYYLTLLVVYHTSVSWWFITGVWRCPWCSRYQSRKWTRRYEFKSWTILIAFHIALIPLGKVWIPSFSLQPWVNSRADWVLQPWWGN